MPLAAGLAIFLVLLLTAVFWLVVAVFSGFDAPDQKAVSSILTAAISTTALIGAALGAVYAFRKQILVEREGVRADQQVSADRFVKAAELLANERPSARLAALHSLASLADDWQQGRNACAMAVSSYLRLPPELAENGSIDPGEREVRRTAWKAIRTRLLDPEAATSWHDQELDFSGGVFDNIDLDHAKLHGVRLQFRGCTFRDGEVRLRGCTLSDASIDFTGATFERMTLLLHGTELDGASTISFDKAVLADSSFEAVAMKIGEESSLIAREAQITRTNLNFDADDMLTYMLQKGESWIHGELDFSETHLEDVRISMHRYEITGRLVFHEVVTRRVEIAVPGVMTGHPYINLDVVPEENTFIRIGPGKLTGGDLRIRPTSGSPGVLSVDFVNFNLLGGEVQVFSRSQVWRSFRFDTDSTVAGSLAITADFPSQTQVDIDSEGMRAVQRRRRPRRRAHPSDVGDVPSPAETRMGEVEGQPIAEVNTDHSEEEP